MNQTLVVFFVCGMIMGYALKSYFVHSKEVYDGGSAADSDR